MHKAYLFIPLSVLCTLTTARPVPNLSTISDADTSTTLYRRGGWDSLRRMMCCSSGFPRIEGASNGKWQRLEHEVSKDGIDTEAAVAHRERMRLEQERHLAEAKTFNTEANALARKRDNIRLLTAKIEAGELGNAAHHQRPTPSLVRTPSFGPRQSGSVLHRRGLVRSRWTKLRCVIGCFVSPRTANPSLTSGEVLKRLGGAKVNRYEALPSVQHMEDLKPGIQATLATSKAKFAEREATTAASRVKSEQKLIGDAQLRLAQAFDRNGAKLTRTQSGPARLETKDHSWLGERSEGGAEE